MRAGNGHNSIHGGSYSGARRKWNNVYVSMVIIAMVFGCGILLGVMGLHRLRDRRNLNLLIRDKDHQILSLHLLLQKEREHTQETNRKTEEMKIKMYNLRARNTELNGRISDMQSMISSLRDEQGMIESHLQEKQNEAKLALTEVIRRKEAEIEDLKHHLQSCAKVEPANENEPSILSANATEKENVLVSETTIKQSQDQNSDRDEHEIEAVGKFGNQETNFGDRSNGFATTGNADSGKMSKSEESDNQELGVHRESERAISRGKQGYLKRAKGKRWKRVIAKPTQGEIEGTEEIDKKIEEGKPRNRDETQDSLMSSLTMQNESIFKFQPFGVYDKSTGLKEFGEENNGENIENSPPGIELENSTKPVDTEYSSVKIAHYGVSKNDGGDINSRGRTEFAETDEDRKEESEF